MAVVRHGKAEAESASGRDFDRELRPRGRRQAAFLASELGGAASDAGEAAGVGRVVSSAAARALATAGAIAEAADVSVLTDERLLVGMPASGALEVIAEHVSDSFGMVVIAGHNPQLAEVVGHLMHGVGGVGGGVELKTGQAYLLRVRAADPMGGAEAVAVLRGEVEA